MKPNLPQDELLQRYEQAKAALPDGLPDQPSAALHERIMQAAREHANAIYFIATRADSMSANGLKSFEKIANHQIPSHKAANDSFWNIRALGSLAVMGLAGLLWWQFEHGTPEEREATSSAKPSASVVAAAPAPAVAPTPALEKVPSSTPTVAKSALPLAPQSPSDVMRKEAPISASSTSSEAKIATTDMATAPSSAPAADSARAREQEATPKIAAPPESVPAFPATAAAQAPPPTAARSAAASVATAPRVLAAPAPAARALIASPDKIFQAIEAKDAAALREAIAQGASPNANVSSRPDGNPALTQAVMQRWAEGVRILLAAGANKEAKNKKGHIAADVAFELGYEDISRLLEAPR